MPRGIEHREPETLMSAFDNYGYGKWAIYTGMDQVICYDGDNPAESRERLENQLNAIVSSGTCQHYCLRVYPDTCEDIQKKSAFKGSTTFMFGNAPVKTENGVTIIDRTEARNQFRAANPIDNSRVEKLEAQLATERELRHKAELNNIRTEFTNTIAGLQEKETPDKWMAIAEKVMEKPDAIKEFMAGIGNIVDKFLNRIPPPAAQPGIPAAIAGTDAAAPEYVQTTVSMQEDPEEQLHSEGQETEEDDEDLTPEQQALMDRLDDAIDTIESKIGTVAMVEALEAIALKNTAKLKLMINML
jgi:hypothetical protein